MDEQTLVERVLSISFVATAPAVVREEVAERVRELARAERPPVRLSYMTELYLGFAVC